MNNIMKNIDNYFNPNIQVTLTPFPDGDRLSKRLGFAAYGIFKLLEAEKTIDLIYLAHIDFYKLGEENTNVLLIIYAFLFGHHKVFDITCPYDGHADYFADIILKAITSGNSAYIHNHLVSRGYYESSYYNNSINNI